MAKYECCGLKYPDGKAFTNHMRSDHNVGRFDVSLSCCGATFAESKELALHMRSEHDITIDVET